MDRVCSDIPVKRVAITTLGCKINQFETAAMTESLAKAGFRLVPFTDEADIYVINTCTVTARTDAESRRLIRRAGRRNPAARVVVTGCYAQVAPDTLRQVPGVHLVLGNAEKKGIAELLREVADPAGPRVLVSDIGRERTAEGLRLESFAEHTRAFLQVQNGCDAGCTYCIVPHARGPSRSVPAEDVLAGVAAFTTRGFREVVLTGIHLGAYGLDLTPATNLAGLLREIEERGLTQRLRLGSVEPLEIDGELVQVLAASRIVCPHLHIPLQSGSDRVLAQMNRSYTAAGFRARVEPLIAALPDLCLGMDVIAGFPGESDEDFAATVRLVESLPVAYLHVFPFSPRPGTLAANLAGRVPGAVVKERVQALRRLSDEKRLTFHRRFLGRELPVLPLQRQGDGPQQGLSRNYLTVRLEGEHLPDSREIPVRITAVAGDRVTGTILSP